MNKAMVATGGALGVSVLSALAAFCCAVPASFAVFGLSVGIATPLSELEPYRPLFTAIGALCLTAAAWWLYRRPNECASGACVSSTRRRTHVVFWISVAAVLGATFLS
jgi:mercuric ion transport protein